MPFTYSLFPAEEHVRIIGKGKITVRECEDIIQRVTSDRLFRSNFSILADLRKIVLDPSIKVSSHAETIEDLAPVWEGNIAVVTTGAILFWAVLLATQARAAQPLLNIKVFGDCASAESFCMKGRLSSLAMAQAN
jgi:hypothetical protein